MESNQQLTTPAVNLLTPGDRFTSASRLHGRLHRWRVLLGKYWWLLTLIVISVVVPVWYLTYHAPPAYESMGRMWLTGKLDLREGRLYTEELIDYLGTQAELLRSPMIQRRALNRLAATITNAPGAIATETNATTGASLPDKAKGLWQLVSEPGYVAAHGETTRSETNPPSLFKVKVREASRSSILELHAIGPEPELTRAFVDIWMEEYLSFKKEARDKSADRVVTSVAAQVRELAQELDAQQEKLSAFQSSNNVVLLQEQGASAGSYLGQLNRKIANLRTELGLLQSLLPEQWIEARSRREIGPSGESLADEAIAREMLTSLAGPHDELFKANQQIGLLKAKRDELHFLKPAHPKIIKLNEEIAAQEKLGQISRDEAVKQMTHRRQAIKLEIQNLEKTLEEWDGRAFEASRKMADYERLRQGMNRLQAGYDKLLELVQTVDLSKAVEQENVGILDPASAAAPINRMKRNLAVALAGSLFLGFGLLYCFGVLRDDFSSLTDLSEHLSEPVVGQIPEISIKNRKGHLGLEALEKQRFEFLESFRTIRSSLLFMGNGGTKPKTILISSSVPKEGKSTVSLYLAATMAMGNARVLLVDADMRRGRLHEYFAASATPGLAEILNGESSFSDAVVHPDLENLALLPAGDARRHPGELVLSAEWSRFLSQVRERFDFILVDTPPLLAASDASALAPQVDGVLFVVRASYTSARMAGQALDALHQRRARVLGLIFNRAIPSRYECNGYQRYASSYHWEPRPPKRPSPAIR
ncbi:MAG: polysaccharide biosynthesis tyrosine autokinase [Verrucomicrobiota bacterium]